MGTSRRTFCIALGAATASGIALAIPPVRRLFHPLVVQLRGRRTVEQRLQEFSAARARVRDACDRAGVAFPPTRLVLLGLKDERRLEVYAGATGGALRLIAEYPIVAASGELGPKLKEGDRQVPEGIYPLESLNPNSRFHAALRVGYPSEFDHEMARRDGRQELGGDIMIHGGSASVGCLAMGDPASEDLFVLAAEAGVEDTTIVLAPVDLRHRRLPEELNTGWQAELYRAIENELAGLQK